MENLKRVEKFWDLNTPQDHRFGLSGVQRSKFISEEKTTGTHIQTDPVREMTVDAVGAAVVALVGFGRSVLLEATSL